MASPQTENGFTKIADEILENIVRFDFNKTETKILMLLIRLSYGFNRKTAEMALSFIQKVTGISKSTVKRNLDNLIDDNVIYIEKEATQNTARLLKFNKDYESWNRVPKTEYSVLQRVLNSEYSRVPKSEHSRVPSSRYQERYYKKDNKKDNDGGEKISKLGKAFSKYLGQAISYYPQIEAFIDDGLNEQVIIEAMKRTSKRDKRPSYCIGILRNWRKKNVKTMEDVKKLDKKFKNKKEPDLKATQSDDEIKEMIESLG